VSVMETHFLQFPSISTLLGLVGILLALFIILPGFNRQRKEPPGPRRLFLFGNLLQLNPKSLESTLRDVRQFINLKKHGPVFTFHFGPQKVVVLAGCKMIKQALINRNAFSVKAKSAIIEDLKLNHGIAFANGESWKEMRSFAMSSLKGKEKWEEKIIEESQYLIDVMQEKDAFDTTQPVSHAVCNVISSLVYGKRFEYDDPVYKSMVARTTRNTYLMGSTSIQVMLFHWIGARRELMENSFANRRHMKELIKGLEETFNPQMCRGVVDSFFARKIQHEASGTTNSHYHEDNLLLTVVNLFTAGTDTTSSTLRYALLLMAKYPKIQDRVQGELSRVVGGRQVRLQDRKNLPYTDAVIHEIQRMASTVPSVLRCASRDVTFQEYFIKKGTPVLVWLSSALEDEDEWEQPHTFNPAHFLDKDGNFRKREAFLPFSAGARVCAGESLARMELLLFFTSLLQHFRFTPPPGVSKDELDLTQVGGFTQSPLPHELHTHRRSNVDGH
uniref:Cytochrome P450, family 2, subfamily X, polypeptide 9 n=1 Tax=Mola mola TaxID=94237 RepID=A0A3Q4B6U1_MOLML